MQKHVYTEYSRYLERDMTYQCYGYGGKLMYAFPPQDGTCFDYSNFGMVDVLARYIDAGKITVVCAGSVDKESWSDVNGDGFKRIRIQENYYHYIVDELMPRVEGLYPGDGRAIATGCSMGAAHAAIFFFRRPDLFDTLIALSGFYRASYFFGSYMDNLVYANSPADFIPNMPADHSYRKLYAESRIIICSGKGAWEGELLPYMRDFERILKEAGIRAWFDYWGYDVSHDWPWWKKQIAYFMPKVVGAV